MLTSPSSSAQAPYHIIPPSPGYPSPLPPSCPSPPHAPSSTTTSTSSPKSSPSPQPELQIAELQTMWSHIFGSGVSTNYTGDAKALSDLDRALNKNALRRDITLTGSNAEVDTDINDLSLPLALAASHVLLCHGQRPISPAEILHLNQTSPLTTLEAAQAVLQAIAVNTWGPGSTIQLGWILPDLEEDVFAVHQIEQPQDLCIVDVAWLVAEVGAGPDRWLPLASELAVELVSRPPIPTPTPTSDSRQTGRIVFKRENRSPSTPSPNRGRSRKRKHDATRLSAPEIHTESSASPSPSPKRRCRLQRADSILDGNSLLPRENETQTSDQQSWAALSADELIKEHADKLDYDNLLRVALCHQNTAIFHAINNDRLLRGIDPYKVPSTITKRLDRAIMDLAKRIGVPETIRFQRDRTVSRRCRETSPKIEQGAEICPLRIVFDTLRGRLGVNAIIRCQLDDEFRRQFAPFWTRITAGLQNLIPAGSPSVEAILDGKSTLNRHVKAGSPAPVSPVMTLASEHVSDSQTQTFSAEEAALLGPVELFNLCFGQSSDVDSLSDTESQSPSPVIGHQLDMSSLTGSGPAKSNGASPGPPPQPPTLMVYFETTPDREQDVLLEHITNPAGEVDLTAYIDATIESGQAANTDVGDVFDFAAFDAQTTPVSAYVDGVLPGDQDETSAVDELYDLYHIDQDHYHNMGWTKAEDALLESFIDPALFE